MRRGTVRSAAALLLAVTLTGGTGPVGAQAVDLAPTGVLRVAVTATSPALAAKDPATGEVRGPWIDLAGALAARLGVPVAVVEYPTDVARDAGMARGEWDVAAGPETPEEAAARGRALAVPFLEVDNTLLVGPASAIRSTADMDRPGVRLAATAGSPPERNLSGLVTRAEVVRVANNADLVPLLAAGQVEALASNRPNVLAFAAQVPGARVLADRYAVQPQRPILAPGRSAASLALASAVTRQALASGLIRTSIARAGIVGVQPAAAVAPGGLPRTGGPPLPPTGVAGAGLVAAAVGLLAAGRRRRARATAPWAESVVVGAPPAPAPPVSPRRDGLTTPPSGSLGGAGTTGAGTRRTPAATRPASGPRRPPTGPTWTATRTRRPPSCARSWPAPPAPRPLPRAPQDPPAARPARALRDPGPPRRLVRRPGPDHPPGTALPVRRPRGRSGGLRRQQQVPATRMMSPAGGWGRGRR